MYNSGDEEEGRPLTTVGHLIKVLKLQLLLVLFFIWDIGFSIVFVVSDGFSHVSTTHCVIIIQH